jgi:hypothetical protein
VTVALLTTPVPYAVAYAVVLVAILASVVAAGYATWALGEALRDRSAIRRAGIGNGRRLVASRAVRAETTRVAATGLVAASLLVLLSGHPVPSWPGTSASVTLRVVVTLVGVTVACVVLATDGAHARRSRIHLDEELRAGHAAAASPHRHDDDPGDHRRDAAHADHGTDRR